MRRLEVLLWLPLVLLWVQPAGAQSIDADTAVAHAQAFRSLYPRLEGTVGERAAFRMIEAWATELGVAYERRGFSSFDGGHSFSSVVTLTLPGSLPDTALIAIPVNHPDDAPATDDGSVALATALAIAEALVATPHDLTVVLAFLGAEFGTESRYPMGTQLLLSDFYPDQPTFVMYVDLPSADDPLAIDTGGAGSVAPAWLIQAGAVAAERSDASISMLGSLNQLHRLGLSESDPRLVGFLEHEIPAVLLTTDRAVGSNGTESTRTVAAEQARQAALTVSGFVFDMLDSLRTGVPSEWDRHYFSFSILGRHMMVGEELYLQLLLVVLFATLLYALLFRHQLGRYLRTIARNIWNLPALFLLVFGLLTAATLLIDLFLLARGFPTLWQYRPTAYVALKLALALFVFLMAAQLLRRLPLSKNGSFYSAASLAVLFADVIIFGVINISYSFFFLWAFACAFLFSVFRNRILKAIMLLAAPVWMVRAAVDLLRSGQLRLTEVLLQSPTGNLLLSFIILPFLLMLLRMDFLIPHPVRGKRNFTLRVSTAMAGLVLAAAVLYVLMSSPFDTETPQPVTATERIDYETYSRQLIVESPAPLEDMDVRFAGDDYRVSTSSRRWQTTAQRLPDVLSVRLVTEEFLDRDRAVLTISCDSPIASARVEFTNPTPLLIYDINFPYSTHADRTVAAVHIGKRPPNPLVISYMIPRGAAPRIDVELTTSVHPEPVEIRRARTDVRSAVELHTSIGP